MMPLIPVARNKNQCECFANGPALRTLLETLSIRIVFQMKSGAPVYFLFNTRLAAAATLAATSPYFCSNSSGLPDSA